ncbi:MAG: hypothetical protein K8F52_08865 [Candidatus Scalindua rubra]|uniref:Pectate lyase superfamily protein n=1 Tax=Candidatus Scalindua brodae TaxID=237368 RepID=A0A0B0EJQ0_9BACT|nr:MAG: Pectate lyase superfamily protein [Candidatus Scalindua brodae]MBZ0108770.1 hypothetical protein [Candidatus Scalindua rubra]TWU30926.1 Pectate lyase superfamily protein [Candidatus Brocadiaceae bacterium S225]
MKKLLVVLALLFLSSPSSAWDKSSIGKPIGDVPYSAYASAKEVDQGAAGHGRSLKDLIDAIGSDNETIVLMPGTYTVSTNETVPANISLLFYSGAVISVDSGKTLTIANGDSIIAGGVQIFSGAGTVDFTVGRPSPVTPKWWGATGDGSTDDTAALVEAFKHPKVLIPAGTYIVDGTATTSIVTRGGTPTVYLPFIMHSNMDIEGVGDVTLKMKDDISSAGSPVQFVMFGTVEDIANVKFKNITFDMNGSNNKIASAPFIPPFGAKHHSAIFIATKVAVDTGMVDGLTIEDCTLTDCAGQNQIILGFGGAGTSPMTQDVIIRNCKFTENGHNTGDHTNIYGWAENVLIEGCTFTRAAVQDYELTGTCIEVHGKNFTIRGCKVEDMVGGVAVCDNASANDVHNVNIYGNDMECRTAPIAFFTRASNLGGIIRDVHIYNNKLTLNTEASFNNLKIGAQVVTGKSMNNIFIDDNTITAIGTPTMDSYGFDYACRTARQKHTNIYFRRNVVTGVTYGFYSATATVSDGDYGNIFIEDNYFEDLVDGSGSGGVRGIVYATKSGNVTDYLKITGNKTYSVKLKNATIGTLFYNDTNVLNSAGTYFEQNTTVTNRIGENVTSVQGY